MFRRRLIAFLYGFHPFIFAGYFPLSLFAINLGEVEAPIVLRPLFAALVFAVFVCGAAWMLVRNWEKSAWIASIIIILFFNYGHFYDVAKSWEIGGFLLGRHRYLVPFFGLVFIGGMLWVIRFKGKTNLVSQFFLAAAALLVVMPLFKIGSYYLPEISRNPSGDPPSQLALQENPPQDRPDVYYIILDAYGRSDVINDLYDYDNRGFLSYLAGKGFYVAENSHSNYNQTALSLATSLNMEYMDAVAAKMGPDSTDRRPLREKMAHSRALEIFHSLGYQFVTFETGSTQTNTEDSDIYLVPKFQDSQEKVFLPGVYLNDFEGLFLKTTLIRLWFDKSMERQTEQTGAVDLTIEYPYLQHRARILFIFDQLGEIPQWEGNYFVFSHILSPHPPFVFGSQGEQISHSQPISFQDTGCCSQEEYIAGYRSQVAYISKLAQNTIDEILSRSDTPPIIILQGDHGPGAYYDGVSMDELKTVDRMGILNAYYFPGAPGSSFYDSITPVNSFRLLFGTQFGMDFPLLPDRSYFAPGARPYDITELPQEWLDK